MSLDPPETSAEGGRYAELVPWRSVHGLFAPIRVPSCFHWAHSGHKSGAIRGMSVQMFLQLFGTAREQ